MDASNIIESTPANITLKQGGAIWLISTVNGLISLYKRYTIGYTPVTVYVSDRAGVRVHVLWMHPDGGEVGSEF